MQTEKYIEQFTKSWLECSTRIPPLGAVYSHKDKLSREIRFEEFLQKIKKRQGEKTKLKRNNPGYAKVIFPTIRILLKSAFNFEDKHVETHALKYVALT